MLSFVIILLAAVFAAANVRAGVVIEQTTTISSRAAPPLVRNRTLMLQGDAEKFQFDDHISVVIDANNQTATVLDQAAKTFRELDARRILGTNLDPNRLLYMPYKSTNKTRELLGFKCRDYTNVMYRGPIFVVTNACFSAEAAGAVDFTHFLKLLLRRPGNRPNKISPPAGMPLLIESTQKINPAFGPQDVSAEELARFKTTIAKIPPQVTQLVVTKITSEKFSPQAFNTPAGYTRRGRALN